MYPCVLSSVDAHACGFAVRCLKGKRRVAFESHCFRAAYVQLDPANCRGVPGDRKCAQEKGKGKLTICPYPEVVSSTGRADGWKSVSEGVWVCVVWVFVSVRRGGLSATTRLRGVR